MLAARSRARAHEKAKHTTGRKKETFHPMARWELGGGRWERQRLDNKQGTQRGSDGWRLQESGVLQPYGRSAESEMESFLFDRLSSLKRTQPFAGNVFPSLAHTSLHLSLSFFPVFHVFHNCQTCILSNPPHSNSLPKADGRV